MINFYTRSGNPVIL